MASLNLTAQFSFHISKYEWQDLFDSLPLFIQQPDLYCYNEMHWYYQITSQFDNLRVTAVLCRRLYKGRWVMLVSSSRFMCSRPVLAPTCENGWQLHESSCYRVSEITASWTEAKDSCIGLGGVLASITSEDEQAFVSGKSRPGDGLLQGHQLTPLFILVCFLLSASSDTDSSSLALRSAEQQRLDRSQRSGNGRRVYLGGWQSF